MHACEHWRSTIFRYGDCRMHFKIWHLIWFCQCLNYPLTKVIKMFFDPNLSTLKLFWASYQFYKEYKDFSGRWRSHWQDQVPQWMVSYYKCDSSNLVSPSLKPWVQVSSGKKVKYWSNKKHFCTIRQHGGGNSNNPTPIQFICTFRKLFFSSFLNSLWGNCNYNFVIVCNEITFLHNFLRLTWAFLFLSVPTEHCSSTSQQSDDIDTTDYKEKEVSDNLKKNPIASFCC